MGRGGKVGGKGSFRKGARSREASSDDSDEDYMVSDEEYSSSLDGFVTEEDEEEERPRVRNFIRSKTKNGIFGWGGNASKTSRKRGRIICEEKEGEEEEADKDEDEDEEEDEYEYEEEEDEYKEEVQEDEEEEEEEEDEEEEIRGMRNFSRSKARNGVCGQRRNASKTSTKRSAYAEQLEEEEENSDNEKEAEEDEKDKEKEEEGYEEEVQEDEEEEEKEVDEEEEIREMRNFSRSKARNGVCSQRKNPSKTSTKRRWITYAEQLEEYEEDGEDDNEKDEEVEDDDKDKGEEDDENDKEEEEEEEEYEEEKVETEEDEWEEEEEGDGDGDEEDEDFDYDDDDDEFTPEEDDSSDEEEEMRGRGKKNIGMTTGKKVLQRRVSVISMKGRKKCSSRASKRPLRNKRRQNGGIRRKLKCDDQDDFIDNGPTIRTTSREKRGQKRRRVLLSDSDCMSSGSPDVVYTISEEEREQVREAKELCGGLRINLSSSLLMKNEECGVHEDLHQLRKPPGRQGKEKTEEPQGTKGKEKVEDLKNEVAKHVCGICLSEENKRRVRGVLNCCTHYFCFACIMEWAKVESRCPLCKQRFTTISKPARSTTGIDLRDVVIQVPERDQVYQPSEEELRSYFDPYEQVICSECHQGGDDGLMLLCDICDSPAHTYCVGLGREVPEGNWYCDGCRPVALGSSSSEVQGRVAEQTVTIQSLPVRLPAIHVQQSIDLNLVSSPHVAFSHGFGHLSSSRFTGRSVEGASPVSGGAPTLSQRRWIHRQIQQLLSIDRMTSTTGRTNAIPATSSASNLYNSQIDHSRQIGTEHAVTRDVGTSYHTFFQETLSNSNTSPLIQNGALWPGLVGTTPILDCEQIHQFSRSNMVIDGSLSPGVREESNFHNAKEQLQSMVKSHLKSMSQNLDLGHNTFKDIARNCMHTILAACGLEPKKSEVCSVAPPTVCSHIDLNSGGQMSLIKGCCSSCFDSFVGDVVSRTLDTRISSHWLRLGL